jgi:CheY-like chemotaxis protein
MAEVSGAADIAKRRVLYELRGGMEVAVRHNIPYRTTASETLTFDLYRPTDTEHGVLPVVLFVTGFSDIGMRSFVGCNAKDMQCYIDWGHLIAASGLAAITYTTTTPEFDIYELLRHLRTNGGELGMDSTTSTATCLRLKPSWRRFKQQVYPVIVITSLLQPEHRVAAFLAGCDEYLLLPVLPDDLVSVVKRVVGR